MGLAAAEVGAADADTLSPEFGHRVFQFGGGCLRILQQDLRPEVVAASRLRPVPVREHDGANPLDACSEGDPCRNSGWPPLASIGEVWPHDDSDKQRTPDSTPGADVAPVDPGQLGFDFS